MWCIVAHYVGSYALGAYFYFNQDPSSAPPSWQLLLMPISSPVVLGMVLVHFWDPLWGGCKLLFAIYSVPAALIILIAYWRYLKTPEAYKPRGFELLPPVAEHLKVQEHI